MMRSLWTAASGMTAQQTNVDVISNNLANVNTTAYKASRMEFKSLLYQTLSRATTDPATGITGPSNLQVGLGVRPVATTRQFSTGNFDRTDQIMDFAINGPGFFMIQRDPDTVAFSRDGNFRVSVMDDGGLMLVTAEGRAVLDIDGAEIVFPPEVNISTMSVDDFGNITFIDADGEVEDLGLQIGIVQFSNLQGLETIGSNLFGVTAASGQPILEADGATPITSSILQGVIEMSNVQLAEEMVRLIIAQRAYEINSRSIQTSDEMLQQAAQLKR
jgi:flagellar basal-body rod protein FlgG